MNTDNITTLNSIEAVFEGEVKSFSGSPNFVSLVDTLKKSFGDFGPLYVLQASGAFSPVSNDADFEDAKANAVCSLRIFLTPPADGNKYLSRKFLTKWMQKNASESIPIAQPVVASLVAAGFKPNVIKKNFNVIMENAGDVDMTLAVFHSICPEKKLNRKDKKDKKDKKEKKEKKERKERKRGNSQSEGPRKKRRCSGGKRSSPDNSSDDLMAVDTPSGRTGQTHELASEFLKKAATAYPEDVVQKLKAKQFVKIILDGNNMLFVTNALRGATLHGKRVKAEKMLSVAALAFSQIIGITTEVVFDATKLPKAMDPSPISVPEIPLVDSSEFYARISQLAMSFPVIGVPLVFPNGTVSVSSARPEFDTTDDKLIAWARANAQQKPAAPETTTTTTTTTTTAMTSTTLTTATSTGTSTSAPLAIPNSSILVVSSDRALAGELSSLGVPMMKPGNWISFFVSLVSPAGESTEKGASFQSFDNWVSGIVDK